MVISIRNWVSRIFFIVLFVALLFIVTAGYRLIVEVISPVHPFQAPRGDALKVFATDPASPEGGNSADRLRWFYWYGE